MTRFEIENLQVGDSLESTFDIEGFTGKLKPNARFTKPRKVVEIVTKRNDIEGKLFVVGYTQFGDTSTISFSIKEGDEMYRKGE